VEEHYQSSVAKMSVQEKVARSIELFNWSREFIGRKVRAENPTASERRLKLLVALQMYGGESKMRQLLEGLIADVPD
ncbi:MAG: hypothetical protein AAGA30_19250, partial [Planctomycetota bacterium]